MAFRVAAMTLGETNRSIEGSAVYRGRGRPRHRKSEFPQDVPRLLAILAGWYNGVIMSTLDSVSVSDVCARVKHLGYTKSRRVRLYGEEFEVVSDPFPEADGIAVHVKSRRNPEVRVLRLPATVLQSVRRRPTKVA